MKEEKKPIDGALLSKEQAAEYLCVSLRTLDKYCEERQISFYKFGTSRTAPVRFKKSDLDKWVRRHLNESQTA